MKRTNVNYLWFAEMLPAHILSRRVGWKQTTLGQKNLVVT